MVVRSVRRSSSRSSLLLDFLPSTLTERIVHRTPAKMFTAFEKALEVASGTYRFIYEGQRLTAEMTPKMVRRAASFAPSSPINSDVRH